MTEKNKTCPVCDEGQLHEQVVQEETEYKGRKGNTPLYFSECGACGSEQTSAVQARTNKRAMIAFRKQVDGLLAGVEVRKLRVRLGVNQVEAAQVFGGGPVAFSKYESDDVAQSEAMDKLLRLAGAEPTVFEKLRHEAELATQPVDEWFKADISFSDRKRGVLKVISSTTPTVSEDSWQKTA